MNEMNHLNTIIIPTRVIKFLEKVQGELGYVTFKNTFVEVEKKAQRKYIIWYPFVPSDDFKISRDGSQYNIVVVLLDLIKLEEQHRIPLNMRSRKH